MCMGCKLGKLACHKVAGEGATNPRVLFVGEAPGLAEDATGRPFVGPSGRLLREAMTAAGLPEEICHFTNLIRCMPRDEAGGRYRKPADNELEACFGQLVQLLRRLQPLHVVAVGRVAYLRLPAALDAAGVRARVWQLDNPTAALKGGDRPQKTPTYQRLIEALRLLLEVLL